MDELRRCILIDLLPQTRDMYVDHVVERCGPGWLFPDIAAQHLARYELPMMAQQVLEEVELAGRELDRPASPRHASADQIHLEVGRLQPEDLIGPTPTEQGTNAGKKLWEGEGLHEVIVPTAIEPEDPVLDRIPGRQNENGRAEAASPQ